MEHINFVGYVGFVYIIFSSCNSSLRLSYKNNNSTYISSEQNVTFFFHDKIPYTKLYALKDTLVKCKTFIVSISFWALLNVFLVDDLNVETYRTGNIT
jgi:hypothetical protein